MLCVVFVVAVAGFFVYRRLGSGKKKACVVVLGDIGRSPRMQYHALSLVEHDFDVFFVGYEGSKPHEDIIKEAKIKLSFMREPPGVINGIPRLAVYALKVLWQTVVLLLKLITRPKCSHILLQNPPCIPTLAVCWVVCVLQGTKLVVDWHNYGYTILGLALGTRHPLVKFSKWYEKLFGRFAHSNICVTDAMKNDLKENWSISATTMHDRPPLKFRSAPIDTQYKLFKKLCEQYDVFRRRSSSQHSHENETIFIKQTATGKCTKQINRPVLLVSSTSWTEDEDFSILLEALQEYESRLETDSAKLPNLICAITGKGPQKEFYQKKIAGLSLKHVQICTPWLEAEDYPTLLGSADIGICLHKSSSGLDLPMKVVDMFGCGLPVCAIHFKCLHELVKHDHNGLVFHSSEQLAKQLQDLLDGYPNDCNTLERYRENLKSFQAVRWNQTWEDNVWPIFQC